MAGFKGDFLGFYFNGIHSSKLGITRVSSGDRYKEGLLPGFEDKSIDIPGNDGSYYYGMYYQTKTFTVDFASDNITETQLINLRRLFGDRKMHQLIFDEYPYKTYYAKLSSPPELSFICFDEGEQGKKERIYKGDGSFSFVCYHPFAHCTMKTVDEIHQEHLRRIGYESDEDYIENGEGTRYHMKLDENKMKPLFLTDDIEQAELYQKVMADGADESILTPDEQDAIRAIMQSEKAQEEGFEGYAREPISKTYLTKMIEDEIKQWAEASGICKTEQDYAPYDKYENGQIKLFNPGDLPAEFLLYLPAESLGANMIGVDIVEPGAEPSLDNADKYFKIKYEAISLQDDEATGVVINTRNHLIEEVKKVDNKYITTGSIHNDAVLDGTFFKIPTNFENEGKEIYFLFKNEISDCKLNYDYLYY